MRFLLTESRIDPAPFREELLNLNAGGYCSFEGWVRQNHLGREVTSLVYEAYQNLATIQGEQILTAAINTFDIIDLRAVHRTGRLFPGDLAVWIGVSAPHRSDAFKACRHVIDEIKKSVPIWKHEFYADGSEVWVDPTDCHCAEHSLSPE